MTVLNRHRHRSTGRTARGEPGVAGRALGRMIILFAGLVAVSFVGLVILNVQYQTGVVPIAFIVWIFVPFALFGTLLNLAIRWHALWRIVAFGAIAMSAAVFALGGFGPAFWLVLVPASGLLAATLPNVMLPPRDALG